jgi:hypothetical protein
MARRHSTGCLPLIVFLLVGAIFVSLGYFLILRPEMEVGRRFVEGRCEILGRQIIEEEKRSKSSTKSRSLSKRMHYRPEFHIRYEVAGKTLEAHTWRIVESSSTSKTSQEKVLARFEVGQSYPCWYDPADPARVVLENGVSMGGIFFTAFGALFVLIGAGGIVLAPLRLLRSLAR